MQMRRIAGLLAALPLLAMVAPLPNPARTAERVVLAPLDDSSAVPRAEAAATGSGLTGAAGIADQSFSLSADGRPAGEIVLGLADNAEMPNAKVCFLAVSGTDGSAAKVIPTIGQGEWEATSCDGVEAVALGKGPDEGQRLIVLFKAQSPNASVVEPIVFDFGAHRSGLSIDRAASDAASLAGAVTIKDVRSAIAK